jgi:hypothetical protein
MRTERTSASSPAVAALDGAKPAGSPLSSVLLLEGGASRWRTAINAIDAVHGDGDLPSSLVRATHLAQGNGLFQTDADRRFVRLLINPSGPYPELTLVHEVGHLLDLMAVGEPGQWATATYSAALDEWRDAVRRSRAVGGLREVVRGTPRSAPVYEPLRYLLRPREQWARSYAQYVAVRSGTPLLLRQVGAARTIRIGDTQLVVQWDDDDFTWIAAALDKLFAARGWRQP